MARKTKEEAEQTRLSIMGSALDTFCDLGYSKTTFDEIAKRIGLTKGAVYWHFNNKPEIITSIITEAFDRVNEAVAKEVPHILTIGDLRKSLTYHAKFIEENNIYRKFLFFIMFQMEWSETFYSRVKETIQYICDYSERQIINALKASQKSGEISKDIDINKISVIINSLWDGLLHNEIKDREGNKNFSEMVGYSFDLIINSIKTKRS
ncbi:MAG: TetR family transcriptional regulator [Lactobacillus sp.]|jgi:TetR/AcrR family acrAB operon transcriptional repressor|nr:TetR family transcriptional regulator [Lactobacillus sp.]